MSEEGSEQTKATVCQLALDVYSRYIKLNEQAREDLILFLLELEQVEDVLPIYEEIIALSHFNAKSDKTIEQFECELCDFISLYPDKCFKLRTSPVVVIRNLIEKYKESATG